MSPTAWIGLLFCVPFVRPNCILWLFAARPSHSEKEPMRFALGWSISPNRCLTRAGRQPIRRSLSRRLSRPSPHCLPQSDRLGQRKCNRPSRVRRVQLRQSPGLGLGLGLGPALALAPGHCPYWMR